jgi:RNA polymerase sigma-70 factor (ECF subfamily)
VDHAAALSPSILASKAWTKASRPDACAPEREAAASASVKRAPTPPGDADGALVVRARAGSSSDFAELYRRHAPAVHAVIAAHCRRSDVDDLVQEAFLRALDKLGSLADGARFGCWIHEIARNLARDALRRRTRGRAERGRTELDALRAPEPVDPRPDSRSAVLAALGELPLAYRETLALRLIAGANGPEIARRTGLTHGSVRVNLCRGMKLLREHLGGRGWTP